MGNLFDRIKQTVRQLRPPKLPGEVTEGYQEYLEETDAAESATAFPRAGYLQEAEANAIIRDAAAKRLLVYMEYNGTWRYVEPYSFKQGKEGLLFFGHDQTRNDTRSYYLHKITQIQLTDIPFNPRWMIEI